MNEVLFSIGEFPVSALHLLLGGIGLLVLGLVVLIILVLRGNGRRIAEAAEGVRAEVRAQMQDRDARIRDLSDELGHERTTNARLQSDAARLTAMMQERDRQNAENLKRFEQARVQMTDEFKVIAGDILKSHGETFTIGGGLMA